MRRNENRPRPVGSGESGGRRQRTNTIRKIALTRRVGKLGSSAVDVADIVATQAAVSEQHTSAWALAATDALEIAEDVQGLAALVGAIVDCEAPR